MSLFYFHPCSTRIAILCLILNSIFPGLGIALNGYQGIFRWVSSIKYGLIHFFSFVLFFIPLYFQSYVVIEYFICYGNVHEDYKDFCTRSTINNNNLNIIPITISFSINLLVSFLIQTLGVLQGIKIYQVSKSNQLYQQKKMQFETKMFEEQRYLEKLMLISGKQETVLDNLRQFKSFKLIPHKNEHTEADLNETSKFVIQPEESMKRETIVKRLTQINGSNVSNLDLQSRDNSKEGLEELKQVESFGEEQQYITEPSLVTKETAEIQEENKESQLEEGFEIKAKTQKENEMRESSKVVLEDEDDVTVPHARRMKKKATKDLEQKPSIEEEPKQEIELEPLIKEVPKEENKFSNNNELELPLLGEKANNFFTLSNYQNSSQDKSASDNFDWKFNTNKPHRKVGQFAMVEYQNQNIFVHQKIYAQFGEKCLENIKARQTLILSQEENNGDEDFSKEANVESFLDKHSKNFPYILSLSFLAKGGEAIIYDIVSAGFDEVVVKVPREMDKEGYSGLLYESQFIQSIYHKDFVVEVKEEIIELDLRTFRVKKACIIIERAKNTLQDIYSQQPSIQNYHTYQQIITDRKIYLSEYKLYYYFKQTALALNYLHSIGVAYCDMKPQNLLVFRNERVKLGDFGISIKVDPDTEDYYLNGISVDYSSPQMQKRVNLYSELGQFFETETFTPPQLFHNDVFALGLTFQEQHVSRVRFPHKKGQINLKHSQSEPLRTFLADIKQKIASGEIEEMEQIVRRFSDSQFRKLSQYYEFLYQLISEKKYLAVIDYIQQVFEMLMNLEHDFQKEDVENQKTVKIEHFPHFCKLSCIQLHLQFQLGMHALSEKRGHTYYHRIKQILAVYQDFGDMGVYICISHYYYCLSLIKLSKFSLAETTIEEFREFLFSSRRIKDSYEFLYNDLKGELLFAQVDYRGAKKLFLLSNNILKRKFSRFKTTWLNFKQTYRIFFNSEYLHELNQTFEMRFYIKSEIGLGQTFMLLGKIKQSTHHFGKASTLIKIFDDKLSLNRIQISNYYGTSVMRLHDFKYGNYQINVVFDDIQEIFSDCFESCAMTYKNLALLSHKLQKDAAIYYYLKAASIYNRVKGSNNLESIKLYNYLAEFYLDRRQYERSLELLSLSVKILRNRSEIQWPVMGTLYCKQAFVYFKLKKIVEARQLFLLAQQIFKDFGFQDHKLVFIAETLRGKFELENNHYQKAFEIFQSLEETCYKIWGEVHCSQFLCGLLQLKALQLWRATHPQPEQIENKKAEVAKRISNYIAKNQSIKRRFRLKRVIFRMQDEGLFYNGLTLPFKLLKGVFDLELEKNELAQVRATITLIEFYTAQYEDCLRHAEECIRTFSGFQGHGQLEKVNSGNFIRRIRYIQNNLSQCLDLR